MITPKQIGDQILIELRNLDNSKDAKELLCRLLNQVWGGSGTLIQRLRKNIEYEVSFMPDKNQGEKILKWFDLYEKGEQ